MSVARIVRSRLVRIALPLIAAGALAAACTSATGAPSMRGAGAAKTGTVSASAVVMVSGGHLTDGNGRTAYLWVADPSNKSVCTGACVSVWPPVLTNGTPTAGTGVDAAKLTTITRSDGGHQVAYAGHALYYFAADTAPGQVTGQGNNGFGAKWWEVNPAGQAVTTMSAAVPSPATGGVGGGNGY